MKFFISDKTKVGNKYGKWYWWTDDACEVLATNEHLVIYSGYTIEKSIEDILLKDPNQLEQANGSYWAVIMTETTVKVVVDYFCQTKIFYRNKDRIEISNAIYLFPFTSSDVDRQEVMKRLSISEEHKKYIPTDSFEKWETFILDWSSYAGSPSLGIRQYSPAMCKTVFKDTFLLEPDHCLIASDKIEIKRIHNTYDSIIDALKMQQGTAEELEDYIHTCMSEHADVIKKKYRNIVSSLSEGIDSVLQDQHFPDAKKIMYNFSPSNAPFDYKQKAIDNTKHKECQVDQFLLDKQSIQKTAGEVMNDPSCFYWDTLPSQQQINNLKDKPDILLYGQNGDNMFMHKPFFYYEYMFCKQTAKELSVDDKLLEFNKALLDFKDCYSCVNNIWDKPANTWQEAFWDMTKEQLVIELENDTEYDYIYDFAKKNTPGLYNREISHAGDVLVTSLFCDKRIFYKVMQAPEAVMLSSIKDAQIQKDILKKKFNYTFETPYKDQAEFNAVHIIKPMYLNTIKYCLLDHLPRA